jgi:hypothetical protein
MALSLDLHMMDIMPLRELSNAGQRVALPLQTVNVGTALSMGVKNETR